MLNPTLLVLLVSAGLIEGRSVLDTRHVESHMQRRHHHGLMEERSVREPPRRIHAFLHRRQNKNDASGTTLLADAIQTGSFTDGSVNGVQKPGQSASQTSKNNFINLCAGKTLTNGLQVLGGSCNGIPMGDIPAKANMVSSIITFPEAGDTSIVANTTFSITVQMNNLVAGSFTNAASTYYAGPQFLQGGKVVGHTHVTVQDMGNSLNPTKPLDPTQFVFFKGINNAGNGQGLLSATVTGGLLAGNYRVCTMSSASNHQPVLMPVAQRGTPDDCTKFTVVSAGNTGGSTGGNTGGNTGNDGGSAASSSKKSTSIETSSSAGPTKQALSTSATESSTADASLSTTKTRKGGNGGKATTKSFATVPPFQNTTIAQTTSTRAAGNGGKGNGGNGNGGKGGNSNVQDTSSSVTVEASTTAASISSPSIVAIQASKKGNGRPAFTAKAGGGKRVVVVHKVIVIKTFFKFVFSLGGLPPAVGKKGQSFVVFEDLFDDFPSACAAACGHQFTKCISFSGPGFSFQECSSQKNKCANVASSASAPAAPETVTATVTVPPTASVTGSVISEVTVTTTAQASQLSQAAPTLGGAEAVATTPAESECAVITNIVFIDPPAPTAAAISSCDIVTSTVFIDPPSATATPIIAAASPIISSKLFPNSTIAITIATKSAPVSLPK
ncbi:hypothetical protein ONS95_005530 [Cadophora gregata]|uniref:uncharacterized protein n=1 Tax=Cadophora gregata TaxID=51156 RepID=UPI0026DAA815|nr:uncharacterized protein ONS95_005530 [Cadophora gregata]KAK0103509.1 hypothetical protein ONS95_005530 [Cadophora gregata]KAK0107702.1 hypothetical protein ONS96_003502 [Cadophora gregata f. sp. sojae]